MSSQMMIVAASGGGSGGGGGGGGGQATVSFTPIGGDYSGTSLNVTITVTSPATKLRWSISGGAFTTVNATSTVVAVPITQAGKFLSADALNSGGTVLASRSDFYQKSSGGGQ